jgi:hypothetical protein
VLALTLAYIEPRFETTGIGQSARGRDTAVSSTDAEGHNKVAALRQIGWSLGVAGNPRRRPTEARGKEFLRHWPDTLRVLK